MKRLEKILAAAKAHGEESDPEHEVGDLQQALIEAWRVMTDSQRGTVYDFMFAKEKEWRGTEDQ